MTHDILVVDDDPVQRRLLEGVLAKQGYTVAKAESGEEALAFLRNPKNVRPKAMILDLVMPEMDGMAVMQALRDENFDIPVIVQTAQGGIETVVRAMRLGAFDFVVKPVAPDRLQTAVGQALRFEGTLAKKTAAPAAAKKSAFTFRDMVSVNPSMQRVLEVAKKAAGSQIPVLVEGESGVGKELIARAIQGSGERAGKPFVTVNCGALPENLVESILFGHEKGAFTGATDKHSGKFAEADGGTLFLDEVGELPLDLQVKLLRAIQEGVIDPVGSKKPVSVDIRLISATNRNLLDEVREGRFREDLYYRLNVLPVKIPPLRERREDIPALVYHFVKRMAASENRDDISAIRPEVMEMLKQHDWPGNIRELENAIFRAIVLCEGEELTIDEFPQIASQMPDFELQAAPGANHDVSLETPMETDFLLPDAPAGPSEPQPSGMIGPKDGSADIPATGMYGMLKLVSGEGQIRPINEIEEETIRFAIEVYNGRMSEVARRLGIGRSTLYRKLKEYGLDGDAGDADGSTSGSSRTA